MLRRFGVLLVLAVIGSACRCGVISEPAVRGTPVLLVEQAGVPVVSDTLDFGPVRVGETATKTLFIANRGRGALVLERIEKVGFGSAVRLGRDLDEADPLFVLPVTRVEILSGETFSMPVSFNAERSGPEAVRLHLFFSNSSEPAPSVLTVSGRVNDAQCDPGSRLDFGGVAVGRRGERSVTVRNPTTTTVTATIGPFPVGSAFSLTGPTRDFTLAPMSERSIPVGFAPASVGLFRDVVPVRASSDCAPVLLQLDGSGVLFTLTWAPRAIDVGFVQPATSVPAEVELRNDSFSPVALTSLRVDSISGTSRFELSQTGALVVPGATRDALGGLVPGTAVVRLTFIAAGLGPTLATLNASTDVPGQPSLAIPLAGFSGGPELSVASRLDFGRVSLFGAAARSLVLRNVGTNSVPPSPSGNLRLGAPAWEVLPANTASQPGELCVGEWSSTGCTEALPPGPDGLAPGVAFSLPIQVVPADALVGADGTKAWDLVLHSNDPRRPRVTVRIVARPLQLGPCSYTTSSLSFGHISAPLPTERMFRVCNAGVSPADTCLISSLDVGAGPFSLRDGPVFDRLLAPQECLTTVVRAEQPGPVPLTPLVSTGRLDLRISDPLNPRAAVPLSATQSIGCLVVDPTPMDFGVVPLGCRSVDRTVRLFNMCSSPITLTSGALVDDGQQAFEVVTPLATTPLTLVRAGSPVTLQLRFRPQTEGEALGAFRLVVSELGHVVDHLVVLRGQGAASARVKESLPFGPPAAADVLLLVDSSCSFEPQRAEIVTHFDALRLAAPGDHHLAVTGSAPPSTSCPLCLDGMLSGTDAGVRVITASTANAQAVLSEWFTLDTGALEGLDNNVVHAFTAPKVFDPSRNAGLLRRDATLGVIVMTNGAQIWPAQTAWEVALLQGIKGANRPGALSVSLIGQPYGASCAPGPLSDPMVSALGGMQVNFCTTTWRRALEEVGRVAFGHRDRVWLAGAPAVAPALSVTSGGQPVIGWQYDVVANAVLLPAGVASGTVEVAYDSSCIP
ncbi:MAG: choice-of-anchor D domain-containing protein [Myxococcales bacterium]|nr:choice-of-anchor D domain-containing protein [Myxococcales bacterium]